MPIYEYKCYNKNCSYELEVFETINSYSGERICPKCNLFGFKRIISTSYFKFKNVQNGMWVGDANKEVKKMYKGFKKKV